MGYLRSGSEGLGGHLGTSLEGHLEGHLEVDSGSILGHIWTLF